MLAPTGQSAAFVLRKEDLQEMTLCENFAGPGPPTNSLSHRHLLSDSPQDDVADAGKI